MSFSLPHGPVPGCAGFGNALRSAKRWGIPFWKGSVGQNLSFRTLEAFELLSRVKESRQRNDVAAFETASSRGIFRSRSDS